MRRLRMGLGIAIASLGLFIALYPLISISRVSGEALAQLPTIPDEQVIDSERPIKALFDGEMIVAQRIYRTLTATEVEQTLVHAGFERHRHPSGEEWLRKMCCGEWDAVDVRAEDRSEGGAVALITMTDGDIQFSWPLFMLVGLAAMAAGTRLSTRRLHSVKEPVSL